MNDFENTNEDHLGDWDKIRTQKTKKDETTLYED